MCLKPTGGFYRLPIKFSAGEGILLAPPKRQRINVDLLNQKIIVTGAARGMGAATVRAYVKAGATVYAMDIANDAGAQMTENANKLGPGTAHYMPVDVAERESVERAFATAYQQMGGLDVLAHPAAIQRSSDASTVTEQEWDDMFTVNVRGTMTTNQIAAKHMQTGSVKVVNPYESAAKQTSPLPAQASRTNGEGVVPNWVLLTTKGSQKAGFQQEEKISVHPIPSLASADAPASPTANAAGQRWAGPRSSSAPALQPDASAPGRKRHI